MVKQVIKQYLLFVYQVMNVFLGKAVYFISARKNINSGQFSFPRKILLLTSTGGGNSHGLSFPYSYFKKELKKNLNLHFFEITTNSLASKRWWLSAFDADIYILSVPVRDAEGEILSKEKVKEFVAAINPEIRNKIIFFGPTDDPVSPYFDVLPYVRLFLMPFTFSDPDDYDEHFNGASKFADSMAKIYKLETSTQNEYHDNLFNSFAAKDQREKLTISWNFTHWRRLFALFDSQDRECIKKQDRPIDVNCRFNQYSGWNKVHRLESAKIINDMSDRYNVVASSEKIPLEQYFQEIENSKILFSPFGWGAICPKEYEAIMKGCLVIKPAIDHINIFPDVLIPGETYVPVKWDLSDLEETLIYFLENESERNRIIENACSVYRQAMSAGPFINKVKEIVEKFDSSPNVS